MKALLSRRDLMLPVLAGIALRRALGGPGVCTLRLPLRTRVEAFKGSGVWQEAAFETDLATAETAIVICDMWDKHWCSGATTRVNALVQKMEPVLAQARAAGIRIVHSPSDTMEFYRDYPQRRRMQELAPAEPQVRITLPDPGLPIDDSDGGCDTGTDKTYKAWTRQHPGLTIGPDDAISDDGRQVYSFLKQNGIGTILMMGVHTNMCVLNRTFAIKRMTSWGTRCILVRDLTDAMYDPKDRPFVTHDQGTELVVQHIERYWCPSTLSTDLVSALRRGKAAD